MTRQAISPRLAIRMRLNMLWFTCNLLGGILPSNLARADGCNNSVLQQIRPEATVYVGPEHPESAGASAGIGTAPPHAPT